MAAGCDISLIGRKAASLSELSAYGLPVPEAYALTLAAYREFLDAPPLTEARAAYRAAEPGPAKEAAAAEVHRRVLDGPWPPALEAELRRFYHGVGFAGVPLAVRSSGVNEDLEGASFAGMYDTRLNIRTEADFLEAVRACWASAWAPRVLTYAEGHGLDAEALGMGVVVQRLVDAEVSGVLFTLDPTTAHPDRMRLESCFGLGEALVSGRVQPDSFLADRRTGAVIEARHAHKQIRLTYPEDGGSGLVETPLDLAEASRPTLEGEALAAVVALGRQVQAHYGMPMDLEWALDAQGTLHLLQARPITALAFSGVEGEWTTADFKDGGVSARVCTPLMWGLYDSIWGRTMPAYLQAIKLLSPKAAPEVWGEMFYGRPYWNVGAVKRCLHKVPGFNERNFDRDLGIVGAYEGDGVVIPVNLATILRAVPVLFALEADYRSRLKSNEAFVAGFAARLEAYAQAPAELPDEALFARFEKLFTEDYRQTESQYFLTIFNTSNAKLDFKVLLDKLNAGASAPVSYLNLLSGLTGMKHLAPVFALHDLAAEALADRAFAEFLVEQAPERLHAQLVPAGFDAWRAKIDTFLESYGHHATAELDLMQPRWLEDPAFVMASLQRAVAAGLQGAPHADPREAEKRQAAAYQAERELAGVRFAEKGLRGRLAARDFFAKLDRLRTYSWWREELRDCSTRMYALVRREALAVAERLVAKGALENALDVFFLRPEELISHTSGTLETEALQALVRERRLEYWGYRNFVNPDELGARFAIGAFRGEVGADGALLGVGGSPGVARGVARVVGSIQEATRLAPGEILVTRFTDPGWTPLFAGLAAVVTETGGLLSHAAVIARESGIPAVLALPEATRLIRDGALIEVDGHAGAVRLLDPAEGERTAVVPSAEALQAAR